MQFWLEIIKVVKIDDSTDYSRNRKKIKQVAFTIQV